MKNLSDYEELILTFKNKGAEVVRIDKLSDCLQFYITVPKNVELIFYDSVVPGKVLAESFKAAMDSLLNGLFDVKVSYKTREDTWTRKDVMNRIKLEMVRESLSENEFSEFIERVGNFIQKDEEN